MYIYITTMSTRSMIRDCLVHLGNVIELMKLVNMK